MTKRERTTLTNKIKRIETRLARKRDEVRTILGSLEGLVESFNEADETVSTVLHNLQSARMELDSATDTMSQLV